MSMRLAVIEFTQQDVEVEPGSTYVEAKLIDPPIDFAIGTGRTVSEAFEDLQARVLDTAIYSARLLHDDPDEWKRRSEQEQASEQNREV